MMNFTDLEKAVLSEISSQYPGQHDALQAQFAAAIVQRRENTGVGFYTHFIVDHFAAPPINVDRIIGNVWAEIEGFESPMTFLVFVEDGYANCLEGATIEDRTTHIDLSVLKFEIVPAK